MEDRKTKLSVARLEIIKKHPFIASLMFNLGVEIKEDFHPIAKTAAVDGKVIYFHPEFIDKLTKDELVFVLAHEIMHCVLLHITRRGTRDPMAWNLAGDIVINYLLKEANIGTMPALGVYDPDMYAKGNGMTDVIYDLIMQQVLSQSASGSGKGKGVGEAGSGKDNNGSMDVCMDSGDDAGSSSDSEAKWKARVASAVDTAKKAGNMPAGIARFVDEILQPKVPWPSVLAQFVRQAKADDSTWARPNRRYMPHGIVMPGRDVVEMDEMVFLIDCSGSITDHILSQFLAEVRCVQEDVRPVKIHVIYFDTQVHHHDEFERDQPVHMKPYGGGGTRFSPAFAHIAEHDIDPVACVMLTDLCCDDFGPEPNYPVLFVSTGPGTAPWGRVVLM